MCDLYADSFKSCPVTGSVGTSCPGGRPMIFNTTDQFESLIEKLYVFSRTDSK